MRAEKRKIYGERKNIRRSLIALLAGMLMPVLLCGCGSEDVPVSSERVETEGAIVPGEEFDA